MIGEQSKRHIRTPTRLSITGREVATQQLARGRRGVEAGAQDGGCRGTDVGVGAGGEGLEGGSFDGVFLGGRGWGRGCVGGREGRGYCCQGEEVAERGRDVGA
jgi:hypothetical protein